MEDARKAVKPEAKTPEKPKALILAPNRGEIVRIRETGNPAVFLLSQVKTDQATRSFFRFCVGKRGEADFYIAFSATGDSAIEAQEAVLAKFNEKFPREQADDSE